MTVAPTDLGDDERIVARGRLAEMADRFARAGTLRSSAWREVFTRTWRHPYVPGFFPDKDSPPLLCIDPARRREWLDTVYSDTTLITKVETVPLSRALRPAHGTVWTSSSTHPSLVLDMLETLDVTDGNRVLEIGTGTGYDCALLCERLGSQQVTSVDIDAELLELAGDRLAAQGHTPTLAAVDGHGGYPPGGPYDRIIATCAVPAIPPAWLAQAAPGAVIVADVHGLLGGTVARLRVDDHGAAVGRFSARWSGFMAMRRDPATEQSGRPRWPWLDLPATESRTRVDPSRLYGSPLGFLAQWQLGPVSYGHTAWTHGRPSVFLIDGDGNRAEVGLAAEPDGHLVRQYGDRPLWDEVEQAAELWETTGRPGTDRFGLSADHRGQAVWLDDPDGSCRWVIGPPTVPV